MRSSTCSAISNAAPADAMARRIDLDAYEQGVVAGDRRYLGQAITLVESTHPDHRPLAEELLTRSAAAGDRQPSGRASPACPAWASRRSSTRSARCSPATDARVAVLAVDPSSTRTGGSILGDKTRMDRLAVDPERVHPSVPDVGHARRRRRGDARGDRHRRGGRLRRRARRDGRRRSVGDDGRQPDRHVPRADARPDRRLAAGHQEGRARARRRGHGEQGRRQAPRRGASSRRGSWRPRSSCCIRPAPRGSRPC